MQRAASGIGCSRHARAVLWEYGRGCTDVRLWLLAGERADIVRAGKFANAVIGGGKNEALTAVRLGVNYMDL